MAKRRLVGFGVVVLLAFTASPVAAENTPPTSMTTPTPPEQGEFRASPTVVTPAGRIAFESVTGCPATDDPLNLQVSVVLSAGTQGFATDVSVDSFGHWSGEFVYEGLRVGPAIMGAECQNLDGVVQRYPSIDVTVVPAQPASSMVAVPRMTG